MELLQEFYLLRVNDFLDLTHDASDATRRNTQYILSRLLERGYVSRLRFFDDTSENACVIYVYFLTDKGASELEDDAAAFSKESRLILRHEIEISQFHIRLALWAKAQGLVLDWRQPKMDHTREINPDAYFGIEDPKKPDGRNVLHYFLEMERAKVGNYKNGEPSIVRKLAKYHEFYDSPDCRKEWGFEKFRVITVVRNSDKQYNLCERLSQSDISHRMFWITTEPHFKEAIGSEIFKTPKDFAKTAYSFLSA